MSDAAPANLSRNTAVMALGTLLSRITGFGRMFALAYAIGATTFSDTYILANNVPNIVYELVLGGVLAGTLVPVFVHRFTNESEDDAWRGISAIFTVAAAVLLVLSVAVFVAAPWIIDLYTISQHGSVATDQREVGTFLLRMFAPQVAFYGFISLATGLLQAKRVFAPPMFAPILNNLVVICVLLALPQLSDNVSLEAMKNDTTGLLFLGLGTTAGVAAMAAVFVPYVIRMGSRHLRVRWQPRHEAVQTVLRLSGWTVGFVITNQLSLWVALVLANRAGNGDVTAYLTAYTLFILPHGIFAVSVITALQPELAERWSKSAIEAFRSQLGLGLRLIAFVLVPTACGLALLSWPFVEVTLLYGEMSEQQAHKIADVLMWMAIGLPGFSAFIFLTRAFQSMQDARTVFVLYALENGVNIATAFPLYSAMGVTGLGLSQTIAYTVGAGIALVVLRPRTTGLGGGALVRTLVRVTLATAAMGLVVAGVYALLSPNAIASLIAAILSGAVTYFGIAKLLRFPEIEELLRRKGAQAQVNRTP